MSEKTRVGHAATTLRAIPLVLMAVGIAVVDTLTDLEIAVGVFQIAIVLLAVRFLPPRGVTAIATLCLVLTLLSYKLSKPDGSESSLINCGISLLAITLSTYLALKMSAAINAFHEARAQLVQISRVNLMGELTASIAHEVNQPLASIVTSGEACLRWLNASPPNQARAELAVQRIINDATRASEIIARIRGFASRTPPHKAWLNITDTIDEMLLLIRTELMQQHILFSLNVAEGLPPILADKIQIQQVLMNLMLNALDAIAATGAEQRTLSVSVERDISGDIRFAVCDHGVGFTPEQRERLFETFFTTKSTGMGMGLTISRSIIEAHGGQIWASANSDGGATFYFTLPGTEKKHHE
ncbi:sensor histidine kinase [Dickeya parazeae]|uniref:sensor histidine kinase n=1 Tax=Dickeya parazeae TaxID=2893572 RepID=UPI001AECBC7A|nr:ATP-binding protein [Dickeya parazeae]MBP2836629.1 two-component sensor histidine kinase [Dickeya parazeae]